MPHSLSPDDFDRIRRLATDQPPGELSGEAAAWLAADAERGEVYEEVRQVWKAAGQLGPAVDVEAKRADWQTYLNAPPSTRTQTAVPVRAWRRYAGAAAAVAAVLLVTLGVPYLVEVKEQMPSVPQTQQYATTRAQRTTVQLPDGSRAILGPATTITFTSSGDTGRIVTLDGQAYFDVLPNAAHPFLVQAAGTTTHVLGTRFMVRHYQQDAHTIVAVETGKVAFTKAGQSEVVLPGDMVELRGDTMYLTRNARASELFGWIHGELVFADKPLRDVIPELERTYDIELRLADATLDTRLLTAILRDASADVMLSTIVPAVDAVMERHGRIVTLRARSR